MQTVEGHRIDLQAQSVYIHGDTPGAIEIARSVRALLEDADSAVKPFATGHKHSSSGGVNGE
jgi:5-oxoprolinase (ATP-hydrolysing) subunit A